MSELGRGLRWTDLRALILTLDPRSHFKRALDPRKATLAEWSTPQVQLLASLWDQNLHLAYARAGQEAPQGSILDSVLQRAGEKKISAEPAKKRRASPAKIRERIKELERASSE